MFFRKRREDKEPLAFRMFGATLGAVVLFLAEVLQIILIAAIIIIPVRLYVVKPFIVKGASMEPNLTNEEYLIIDEISQVFSDFDRGTIVVFEPPGNESQVYIKRIIGLPGETVEIEDGVITIFNETYPNGIDITEDYIDDYTHGRERVTLGLEEYYVLGDNRDASLDSRKFGAVHESSIIGKAWLRGLPLEKIGALQLPDYDIE